jgi:hypothetical protein
VRIIGFALLLDGGVSKSADRRTQTLDRLISNPKGFRQSVFQDLALGIEGLLGRDGIAALPSSERTNRSRCRTFQARNRLCFDASKSSSKSWIALGVIAMVKVFIRTRTSSILQIKGLKILETSVDAKYYSGSA